MPKLNDFFNQQAKEQDRPLIKKMHPQNIHYSKLEESSFQYRDISQEDVEKLADLILLDGEVLQPLLIRKKGGDNYEILAGHKRFKACRYLVEEQKQEKFAFIPCYIKELSDAQAEFSIYSTNGYSQKSDYEMMCEVEGMARLLKEHPEAFPSAPSGRLVEKLAEIMKMSKTVVQEYKTLSSNLGESAKQMLKEEKITKESAKTLASIPKDQQDKLLERGITKTEDIKSAVSEIKEPTNGEIIESSKWIYCKDEDMDLKEYFIDRYGSTHSGGGHAGFNYSCSRRGIKINNKNEITWNTYISRLIELGLYIPKKNVTEPVTHKEEKEAVLQNNEALSGQMKINDIDMNMSEEKSITESAANSDEHDSIYVRDIKADAKCIISRTGACPSCQKAVIYEVNKHYCGFCGKLICWKM